MATRALEPPRSRSTSASQHACDHVAIPPIRYARIYPLPMAFSITMIILALIGSAFISSAESALLSARLSRIEHLAEGGNRRARLVMSVLERYENFFATILLFGNLFNIIVAVAASNLLVATIADGETTIITNILATAIATILVYTIGELTPKTIGAQYPETWSLKVAHIISALIWIARPVVAIFTWLAVFVMRILRISETNLPIYTSGEISLILDRSQEQGVFDDTHGEMIDNLLEFGVKDLRYPEVRVHTSEIIWLDINDTLQTFLDAYKEHEESVHTEHGLMPGFVVREGERQPSGYWYTLDQIAGVVYTKDVVKTVANHGFDPNAPIRSVMEQALSSRDITPLDDVLKEMIRDGHEMVVSVNALGRVNGIVTLKGILELMRGDEDYLAIHENAIQKPDANTFVVPGALSIEGTRKETGLEIPLNPRYETIAGFFIDKLQRAPEEEDSASHGETIMMHVVQMEGNRIQRIKLTRIDPEQMQDEK